MSLAVSARKKVEQRSTHKYLKHGPTKLKIRNPADMEQLESVLNYKKDVSPADTTSRRSGRLRDGFLFEKDPKKVSKEV